MESFAAAAVVVALGILPFVAPRNKNTVRDVTMFVAARRKPLLTNSDAETAKRFEISFDSTSSLAYVSNPLDGTVMRFDENGQYFYNTKLCKTFILNDCPPVTWSDLNGYVKKNNFIDIDYITDSINHNVFVPNEGYMFANPKEATLFEPVQTAVFEDAKNWREYVIDRAGNKLLSFAHFESKEKCDRYSKVLWSVPKNKMMGNAPIGEDNYSFSGPSGVCVDGVGNVYVADTGNDRIMKYSSKGEFQSVFQPGFDKPRAVAVNAYGSSIFVCDSNNKRVVAIDTKTKKTILTVTNAKFANPDAICLDAQGAIWVGDSVSNTLFKFSGTKTKKPGVPVFAVNDVLTSKKFPRTVLEMELMRYSCKRNEQTVKIRPYAQYKNKIPCVPIEFVFDNLIKDESRGGLEGFSCTFDVNTKCLTVNVPEIQVGEGKTLEKRTVSLCVDCDMATVNGKDVLLSGKVTIIGGSVFAPAVDLTKLFGVEVSFKEPKTEPVTRRLSMTLVFPPIK
ncbi:MAG: hypothetical protein KA140_04260 [Caldisericia bacterium]|nr:hypothetical protein [Caldisericia bacterium]